MIMKDFIANADAIIKCENEALAPKIKEWHDVYKGVFTYYEYRGIPLTKDELNGLYNCIYSSVISPSGVRGITKGNRVDVYIDPQDRREYLSSLFMDGQSRISPTLIHYCMNPLGEFCLDGAHMRLLYNVMRTMRAQNVPNCPISSTNLERLHDAYCYIRAEELLGVTSNNTLACSLKEVNKDSTAELPRLATQIKSQKNKYSEKFVGLMPVYKTTLQGYSWNTCKASSYEYFSYVLVKPDKDVYVFRPRYLLLKLLVNHLCNKSIVEIENLNSMGRLFTSPVFYRGLDLDTENLMLPDIVDSTFDNMDGMMQQPLLNYNNKVLNNLSSCGLSTQANVYTKFIAQKAETIMGMLILNMYEEYHRVTGDTKHQYLRVLNATPYSMVLEVAKGCDLRRLLPESHSYFTLTRGCGLDSFVDKTV